MNIYLACFDISDDKIRNRIGKLMEAYGDRVQKSVFEIIVKRPEELEILRDKIRPLLEAGDDVRLYRLCAECRDKSQNVYGDTIAQFPAALVI